MRSRIVAGIQGSRWGTEAGMWMLYSPDEEYTVAHGMAEEDAREIERLWNGHRMDGGTIVQWLRDGAKEERARIVAWLRMEAHDRPNLSDTPRHNAIMICIDAIERGEHLK